MTINGKQDGFTFPDLRACAEVAGLKRGRCEAIVEAVAAVLMQWPRYAEEAGVSPEWREHVAANLRLGLRPDRSL